MNKIILIVAALSMCIHVAYSQVNRLSEQVGDVKKVTAITGGYEFKLADANARIIAYNATTIRIRVSKQTFNEDFSFAIDDLQPKGTLKQVKETDADIVLATDSLNVYVHKKPFRVSFYNKKDAELCADDKSLGISWFGNQVSCYKKMHPDEAFIGLGEKTGDIDRRGHFYQNWNTDMPAYGVKSDPLYTTIPFFIGIHNKTVYGIFFDNTFKSYFNFGGGADEQIFHFGADDGEMNYYFFGASTIPQIIFDYTTLTGRTPMPPLWSIGFQQSRWGYNSQQQLLDIAKTFRDKKMPADAIVSDIIYMDNYKVFTWDPKSFPDPKGMMQQMKQMGFDVVTIIDPGIKVEKGYKAYDEGVANHCFVKYPNDSLYIGHVWPGRCNFPDFTKESTVKWWGDNFKASHTDNGIRGFWNDMNEPAVWGNEMPNLIEFGEGTHKKTLFEVKNVYGLLMAKSTYLGTRRDMDNKRPFVLTRAGYSGVQKYSAQWTGDNVSTDENLLLSFRLLSSMGVSGDPFTGMDIGGFMGNPTPDLFVRWMSTAVYSPLYRNHTCIDYDSREPWLFGEENTRKIRKSLELRYKLMPYLYSAFYQAHTSGMPINRMLPINYTYDDRVYDTYFENEFLFGDNMLVCPVVSTQMIASIYLPGSNRWYRFNEDDIYVGGKQYNVDAPLDNLPVFIKEGAIIPMQSILQNTKEKGDGILYLNVWKGSQQTAFTYYEDDGETYNYENGAYYKRTITYDPSSGKLTLASKDGSYATKYTKVKVILHGFDKKETAEYTLQDNSMTIDLK